MSFPRLQDWVREQDLIAIHQERMIEKKGSEEERESPKH